MSFRYVISGITRSIPSISSLGKASPQSTTIMLSSYSNAVMFIPICSSPPSGIIFIFLLAFFALPLLFLLVFSISIFDTCSAKEGTFLSGATYLAPVFFISSDTSLTPASLLLSTAFDFLVPVLLTGFFSSGFSSVVFALRTSVVFSSFEVALFLVPCSCFNLALTVLSFFTFFSGLSPNSFVLASLSSLLSCIILCILSNGFFSFSFKTYSFLILIYKQI